MVVCGCCFELILVSLSCGCLNVEHLNLVIEALRFLAVCVPSNV